MTSALGRLRKVDYYKFEASLGENMTSCLKNINSNKKEFYAYSYDKMYLTHKDPRKASIR